MTSEPHLHSAAFSEADRVLAARIRERDDRIAKLEERVAELERLLTPVRVDVRTGAVAAGVPTNEPLRFLHDSGSPPHCAA